MERSGTLEGRTVGLHWVAMTVGVEGLRGWIEKKSEVPGQLPAAGRGPERLPEVVNGSSFNLA